MRLSHLIFPHPETHKRAHLISLKAIAIYILIFFVLQIGLNIFAQVNPGVLGINSSVDQKELIRLTNEERVKAGLPRLRENPRLNLAAEAKAQNMFEEDYWAHYSPSGKDPWGFINAAGYKFTFAGENLARNFYTSDEVVKAWMASPTHKENIVNNRYQEIGIAVVEGNLKGQKTVLVVQEFGTPVEAIAQIPEENLPDVSDLGISSTEAGQSGLVAGQQEINPSVSMAVVDPYQILKTVGVGILGFVGMLLLVDLYILRKRAVVSLAARHTPHFALISLGVGTLMSMGRGSIL